MGLYGTERWLDRESTLFCFALKSVLAQHWSKMCVGCSYFPCAGTGFLILLSWAWELASCCREEV